MWGLPESVRILLYTAPTDMRKGFEGLTGLVRAAGEDVYGGALFVFVSRRRDRLKILTFQKGGFVLWYKRLERGRFKPTVTRDAGRVTMDSTDLSLLLEGIDVARVRRPKRWRPQPASEASGRIGIDIREAS